MGVTARWVIRGLEYIFGAASSAVPDGRAWLTWEACVALGGAGIKPVTIGG